MLIKYAAGDLSGIDKSFLTYCVVSLKIML